MDILDKSKIGCLPPLSKIKLPRASSTGLFQGVDLSSGPDITVAYKIHLSNWVVEPIDMEVFYKQQEVIKDVEVVVKGPKRLEAPK